MHQTTATPPRLYTLDGLRGLCALSIMLFHLFFWNGVDLFQIGYFGVYLFFVLSGFSMWYVYAHQAPSQVLFRHFFAARVARILPLYALACLLAVAARCWAQGLDTVITANFISRFALNITLLFGFAEPGRTSIVPGGWSIGIEWVFYMTFPVFLLCAKRLSTLLLLTVAFGAINQLYVAAILSRTNLADGWVEYTQFAVFLVYFSAGMTMAELYRISTSWRTRLSPVITQGASRMIPLFCLAVIFFYPSTNAEAFLSGVHFALLMAAAMLAIGAASLLTSPNAIEIKIYKFLGDISYSTYLLHFFVYKIAEALLIKFYPTYSVACLTSITAIATLGCAYLCYRLFESPARSWINRKLG